MDTTPDQVPTDPVADPATENPQTDVLEFADPIIPNPDKFGAMDPITAVEYLRAENGQHVFRLPDGRVTAAPDTGGDRAADISRWIAS